MSSSCSHLFKILLLKHLLITTDDFNFALLHDDPDVSSHFCISIQPLYIFFWAMNNTELFLPLLGFITLSFSFPANLENSARGSNFFLETLHDIITKGTQHDWVAYGVCIPCHRNYTTNRNAVKPLSCCLSDGIAPNFPIVRYAYVTLNVLVIVFCLASTWP